MFACENGKNDLIDGPGLMKLMKSQDIKIRRHVKVKADANPYDPQWRSYFAGRTTAVAGSDQDL